MTAVIVTHPPSSIIKCKSVHLQYLCGRAREDERIQYAALSGHDEYDPDRAWYEFVGLTQQGPSFTALDSEDLPAASGGYHMVFPGVWQSWMVGTEAGWKNHWRDITKGCRWLADSLFDGGARRLQTSALASRTAAIRWYTKSLKMEPCGVWKQFGIHGEDVAMFQRLHPGGA